MPEKGKLTWQRMLVILVITGVLILLGRLCISQIFNGETKAGVIEYPFPSTVGAGVIEVQLLGTGAEFDLVVISTDGTDGIGLKSPFGSDYSTPFFIKRAEEGAWLVNEGQVAFVAIPVDPENFMRRTNSEVLDVIRLGLVANADLVSKENCPTIKGQLSEVRLEGVGSGLDLILQETILKGLGCQE